MDTFSARFLAVTFTFLLRLQTERIKSVIIVYESYDNGNYQFK